MRNASGIVQSKKSSVIERESEWVFLCILIFKTTLASEPYLRECKVGIADLTRAHRDDSR